MPTGNIPEAPAIRDKMLVPNGVRYREVLLYWASRPSMSLNIRKHITVPQLTSFGKTKALAVPVHYSSQRFMMDIVWCSQVAKDLGPGHTVVTCLCDSGQVCIWKCYHGYHSVCLWDMLIWNVVGVKLKKAMQTRVALCDCHKACMLLQGCVTFYYPWVTHGEHKSLYIWDSIENWTTVATIICRQARLLAKHTRRQRFLSFLHGHVVQVE